MTEQEIKDLSQIKDGYYNTFIGNYEAENITTGVPADKVIGNGIPFTEVTFFSKMPFKKFIDKMVCKIKGHKILIDLFKKFIDKMVCKIKGHKILIDLEEYERNFSPIPSCIACYRCKRYIRMYYYLKKHFS